MYKIINCVVCDKEIIAINKTQLRRKFCCNPCRYKYYRYHKQKRCKCGVLICNICDICRKCMIKNRDYWGEKNPRYNKGTSGGYIQRLSTEAIIKDGRRLDLCEDCGKTGEIHKEIKIHHIDMVRTNNNPSNLKVLCKSCHRRVHWNNYKIERICAFCKNKFMSKRKDHIYCSKKCYMKGYYRKLL